MHQFDSNSSQMMPTSILRDIIKTQINFACLLKVWPRIATISNQQSWYQLLCYSIILFLVCLLGFNTFNATKNLAILQPSMILS